MQSRKTPSFLLLVLIGVLIIVFGGRWYYKRTHPEYVPLPPRQEISVTIIPGWNLSDIADLMVSKGFASSSQDVFILAGKPAEKQEPKLELPVSSDVHMVWDSKPSSISLEGYFEPETFRVFANESLANVLAKFILERNRRLKELVLQNPLPQGKDWHEILTMASLIEREVKFKEDKALVSDILWRRLGRNWALQLDSSVQYAVGSNSGSVFTTAAERNFDSLWNTYKHPGLPLGPISNPGLESVEAALNPQKNSYWYFLTDKNGKAHYGSTLDEHNINRSKYIR